MRVLILGGTQFLGRHIADACLEAGHELTLFNRGQTDSQAFRDVAELVVGDRDGGLEALRGRSFDVCIDPSGYVPRLVRDSCEILADVVRHYTFVSSISVYPTFTKGQDESAPLAELEDPTTEVVDGETYGGLKVLCEAAAEETLPGRVLHVRSGLIVGSHDPTDRFSFWPVRIAAGGEFAAPVGPDVPVQVIDARDQADWIVQCATDNTTGVFNVTGRETTLGAVFDAALEVTGADATPVWLPADFLAAHEVQAWTEMPLYIPRAAAGMMQVDTSKAEAVGLTTRPLTDTIADLLAWHPGDLERMAAGIKPVRESELLAAYRDRPA